MSDSINEQRCGTDCAEPHIFWDYEAPIPVATPCPGPSVITPPAQDDHGPHSHLDSDNWLTCERCTAAPSVSTDDEKLKAELLRLCVPMQHGNGYQVEAIPKAALLDFFAIRALESRRG